MIVQEAKKHLENIYPKSQDKRGFLEECIDIAIECMKEIEQYRALGTPTQILEKIGGLDVELGKYHSIGTVEELKAAKEKQVAKKPIIQKTDKKSHYKCECGYIFLTRYKDGYQMGNKPQFCEKCGNKMDWSEEDD